MNKAHKNLIVFAMIVLPTIMHAPGTVDAKSRRLRPAVGIHIELKKELFREYEPVIGQVIITNTRPATFPVNFTVQLFRNGEFYRRSIVNTPVFSGRNKLNLATFGAKDVFTGPHAVAHWRMEISTGGDLPVQATAEFRIVSEDYTEKPARRSKYIYATAPDHRPSVRPKKRARDVRTVFGDY